MQRHAYGKASIWWLWGVFTVTLTGYFLAGMLSDSAATSGWLKPARQMLLPGRTTDAHHQIELTCNACHVDPFGGREAMQDACVGCHGAALNAAEDSHPTSKFLDPRNAALAERLDATLCVTCHVEHRPEITSTMALTMPVDVCAHCHAEIGEVRPSHAGMSFATCASAGCHNFHDNQALYEDFLLKHSGAPAVAANPVLPSRDYAQLASMLPGYPSDRYPAKRLERQVADAPPQFAPAAIVEDWLASSHATAGVNCSACHAGEAPSDASSAKSETLWTERPSHTACASCHTLEVAGFTSGKHGMRVAQGLTAMQPAQARLPMHEDAHDARLTCTSCHGSHRFDARKAAVDACTTCHADEHTRAYQGSRHFELWRRELAGDAPPGSGVSCASCHLPRVEHRDVEFDIKRTLVQHNQSDTLRPNEKMVRAACLSCHSLQFSLDALADEDLIERNFAGAPTQRVRSIDMANQRLQDQLAQRSAATTATREEE